MYLLCTYVYLPSYSTTKKNTLKLQAFLVASMILERVRKKGQREKD